MEFSCVVEDSKLLLFVVNDTFADKQSVIDKGFIQHAIPEDSWPSTRIRNLTATASTKYNNTEIKCFATNFVNELNSSTGILLVQGKLLLRLISLY